MDDTIENCVGTWQLTGYAADEGLEAGSNASRDEDLDAWSRGLDTSVDAWLNEAPEDFPDFRHVTGLTLTIDSEGTFDESGDAGEDVRVVSADGVLGDSLDVYEGQLREQNARLLAFTDEPSDGDQRLNDGDTQITDEFFPDGNELIRVVSMVTDGMYLDRFFYRYESLD